MGTQNFKCPLPMLTKYYNSYFVRFFRQYFSKNNSYINIGTLTYVNCKGNEKIS